MIPAVPARRRTGLSLPDVSTVAAGLIDVARGLQPEPVCLGLVGTLGAGKTQLATCFLGQLGIDPAAVTSPTFSLWRTHSADGLRVHHLDAYRVNDADEWFSLGVDEVLDEPNHWTLIEWADRFADQLPVETIWVQITPNAQATDQRDWCLWCQSPRTDDMLGRQFPSWQRFVPGDAVSAID